MERDTTEKLLSPSEFKAEIPFTMTPVGTGSRGGIEVHYCDLHESETYEELAFPGSKHHMLNLGLRGESADRRWGGMGVRGAFPAGTICCIPSGMSGRWDNPQGGSSAIHIYLPDASIRQTAMEADVNPDLTELRPSLGHLCPRLASIMRSVFDEFSLDPICSSLLEQSLSRYLSGELLRSSETSAYPTKIRSSRLTVNEIRRVHAYMNERIGEDIRVEDLAGVLRRSPYEFIRQFGRGTGLPPHRYLTHLRVERVAARLRVWEAKPMPLSQIALQYGFADQSHLTRVFKRLMGVTPAAYRREHLAR